VHPDRRYAQNYLGGGDPHIVRETDIMGQRRIQNIAARRGLNAQLFYMLNTWPGEIAPMSLAI